MKVFDPDVEDQYERPKLLEDIIDRLKTQGIDPKKVTREDLAGVDEFHVRGAAVSRELAALIKLGSTEVLDVGCGLGGPCRMLADEFNCTVTGIDLSKEFIRTAIGLTDLVGLSDQVKFIQGDATKLPFADQTFQVVWTQHVQMNIKNKKQFYGEIARVLKQDGKFLFYDIFKNNKGSIDFPVPWANHPEISHLITPNEAKDILQELGLQEFRAKDQTEAGIHFFEKLLERLQTHGPPTLGLNVIMGNSTKTKLTNLLRGLRSGDLMLQSGVFAR